MFALMVANVGDGGASSEPAPGTAKSSPGSQEPGRPEDSEPADRSPAGSTAEPRPVFATSKTPYLPTRRPDGKHVVALDIGHTIAQPGCYSATGRGEFFFNQQIVELISSDLKDSPSILPYVINPEGAPISLSLRARVAARQGAELFLAIHHDSVQDKYLVPWQVKGKSQKYCDTFQGFGVFVSEKNGQFSRSLRFARLLGKGMGHAGFPFSTHHSEAVKGENRRILDSSAGIYAYDDLIVLKTAPMPAALLECGVIVNREQERLLSERPTQEKIAQAVCAAVEEFFHMEESLPVGSARKPPGASVDKRK
jgi:N-acetylmuramoyl-L-alanine amidase